MKFAQVQVNFTQGSATENFTQGGSAASETLLKEGLLQVKAHCFTLSQVPVACVFLRACHVLRVLRSKQLQQNTGHALVLANMLQL